jgi:ubiquinone/menaquinone biosynthesis C-methylase UbiE
MSNLDLLIDLHLRNDRQGPGSDAETRRAINLTRLDPNERLAIADIGCGTGASSFVLAKALNGHITAVDFAEPFVERLRKGTATRGLSDYIEPFVGQMGSLPFDDKQFDLIWSEGAIYNMGFAEGLNAWRRFLRPGGVVAVSEITWTTAHRPAEVESHWNSEYPGIATASAKLQLVEQEGYEPLGIFFLPRDCWEQHYYEPLRSSFPAFLERQENSEVARQVLRAEEAEMSLYHDYGQWYSYAFYIARRT